MANQDTVTRIADRLADDPVISSICGDRVLDADYRLAGWNTSPVAVTDQDGLMLTTLAVDDGGAQAPLMSRFRDPEVQTIHVWCFGNRNMAARHEISDVLARVRELLHNWQDPETRSLLRFSMRLGSVTADDGVYDRATFSIGNIPVSPS